MQCSAEKFKLTSLFQSWEDGQVKMALLEVKNLPFNKTMVMVSVRHDCVRTFCWLWELLQLQLGNLVAQRSKLRIPGGRRAHASHSLLKLNLQPYTIR